MHKLPDGFTISSKSEESFKEHKSINGVYSFDNNELSNLYLIPKKDFSGIIEFEWKAIAKETIGSSSAISAANTKLYIKAVADSPLMPEENNAQGILIQGRDIELNKY